ncbi:MAG: hypothetical protein R3D83_10685 [Caenibius sp.]
MAQIITGILTARQRHAKAAQTGQDGNNLIAQVGRLRHAAMLHSSPLERSGRTLIPKRRHIFQWLYAVNAQFTGIRA